MKYRASPNFNERKNGCGIEYVMLHYTGMTSSEEALDRLCDPKAEVSAHYLIDEDGVTTKMVDEKLRAWHAGLSQWKGQDDLNSTSIGIELSNPGHEFTYHDFPQKQLDSLEKLLTEIFQRYDLPAEALLAHSDVAPSRKKDPGEKFPWQDFAAKGFGIWPIERENKQTDLKTLLEKAGYNCTDLDAAKTAFQRRYCQKELNTSETKLTIKRLNGLCTIPCRKNLSLSQRLRKWFKSF